MITQQQKKHLEKVKQDASADLMRGELYESIEFDSVYFVREV